MQGLVANYINNFLACYIAVKISIGLHLLEKGIVMVFSITSILLTAAFEIIVIGGKQMVRGVRYQLGQQLSALQSYMDAVTTLLQTPAGTFRPLKSLEELLTWAQMKIKPP